MTETYRRNRDAIESELLRDVPIEEHEAALIEIRKTYVWQSAAFRDAVVQFGLALAKTFGIRARR